MGKFKCRREARNKLCPWPVETINIHAAYSPGLKLDTGIPAELTTQFQWLGRTG